MFTRIIAAALALTTPLGIAATPTAAQVAPFPEGFRTEEVSTNGTTIHTRIGGKGPAVVLLHGYGETGDM